MKGGLSLSTLAFNGNHCSSIGSGGIGSGGGGGISGVVVMVGLSNCGRRALKT